MLVVLSSYLLAVKMLATDSRLLGLCVVPWLSGILLFIVWAVGVWWAAFLPLYEGVFALSGTEFLSIILATVTVFLVASVGAVFSTLLLNEFTTEELARRVVEKTTGSLPPPRPLIRQCTDSLARLAVLLIIGLLALLVGLIPLMQPVALLLSALNAGILLGDFALCVTGMTVRDRVQTLRRNSLSLVLLGLFFLPSFVVPLVSLLLLPLGYTAAAILLTAPRTADTPKVP